MKDETISIGDELNSKFSISDEEEYSNYDEKNPPNCYYSKYTPEDDEEQKEGGDPNQEEADVSQVNQTSNNLLT